MNTCRRSLSRWAAYDFYRELFPDNELYGG